jgi:hypothetical protein
MAGNPIVLAALVTKHGGLAKCPDRHSRDHPPVLVAKVQVITLSTYATSFDLAVVSDDHHPSTRENGLGIRPLVHLRRSYTRVS